MEQMLKKYNKTKASLFQEGFLGETFKTLEGMRDDKNPDFPFEMITLFLMGATRKFYELRVSVTPSTMDIDRADALVHDIKGSCASIGALRIRNLAELFRIHFLANNVEGCIATAHQLIGEFSLFKQRIDPLMQLSATIVAAGGKFS